MTLIAAMTPEQFEARFGPRSVNELHRPDLGLCRVWKGCTADGYGRVKLASGRRGGRGCQLHRLAYETFIGPVPNGLWVLHRCDVRACWRPAHLFTGTGSDNTIDMYRKRLHPLAKLSVEQVREIRAMRVHRPRWTIARAFGVSYHTIGRILRRERWQEV